MLKMKGSKEFLAWWEHWMSRIHPYRIVGQPEVAKSLDVSRKGYMSSGATKEEGGDSCGSDRRAPHFDYARKSKYVR